MRMLGSLLLALVLGSLAWAQEVDGPSAPPATTEEATPDRDTRFRAAALYSRSRSGVALLVQEHGEVVFEDYAAGSAPRSAHDQAPTELASGTKSFWGVAAMCAVHDGLLSLDELAADTLTEWAEDERKSKITVRQLLDLSSGLAPASSELRGPRVYDRYLYAVESVPAVREPGERFEYGPSHFFAFGELLRRKLVASEDVADKTPYEYLARRVLTPIGLHPQRWRRDGRGHETLPYGALLTAREWARFGTFVLDGGHAGDVELLPAKLLAQCFEPSARNPAYGLTWWLGHRAEGSELPSDLVYAAGKGKQRLYVIPSRALVVVRQAPLTDDSGLTWSDTEFLGLLLNGRFPPDDDAAVVAELEQRAAQLLLSLDRNGDGTLAPDETRGVIRRGFRRLDLDGDGALDRDEVLAALRDAR